jgi:hypothetical protein
MRPLLILLVAFCFAAAPATTKPAATNPAKPPEPPKRVRDGLVKGAVRFLVPVEWEIEERNENGLQVRYRADDSGQAKVSMLVTQQAQGIPPNDARLRQQLAKFVIDGLNKSLKEHGAEIIDPPKIEPDARFFLRIHERFKDKEGEGVYDQVHFYRAVGINLIDVTATAVTEDKEEAKRLHEAGALMLMSVTTGPADPKIVRQAKP